MAMTMLLLTLVLFGMMVTLPPMVHRKSVKHPVKIATPPPSKRQEVAASHRDAKPRPD